MKKTSKTLIFFILTGYTIFMLFAVFVGVEVYKGIKTETKLSTEFKEIETLINNSGLDDNKIDMKLNNYITDGEYKEVEIALKSYLKDLLVEFRRLDDIYTDNKLNSVIYLENFDDDAPYFTSSISIIANKKHELEQIKDDLLDLFTEDKIMSYIAKLNLSWYYEEYYKSMLLNYDLLEENKTSISDNITHSISILDAYNNYFTFLSDNADYWTMDEDYIYFDSDELVDTYNYLLDIITNANFSNGVENFI